MPHIPTCAPRLSAVPVGAWQVQSSAVARDPGERISRAGYRAEGWLDAPARSTVMAALLANGNYPDVFLSTAMRDTVPPGQFGVPWWYRSTLSISGGGRTALHVDGIIHRAQLWVNGTRVADETEIAGAYPVHTFDITGLVHRGINAIAFKVFPGHPMTDLSVGWIDWNPMPPDGNMGIWRDVIVMRTGPVRLADPHITSAVAADHGRADLQVAVDVVNGPDADRVVTVTGSLAPDGGGTDLAAFARTVPVRAGERIRVVFTAADTPALSLGKPELWWPIGHGEQNLHELRLDAAVDGISSDLALVTFGIRQVDSSIQPGGGRLFSVNGRPVQVLGAGWCPDLFLRYDRQRLADQLGYVADLGLNAVRLEGRLETAEFYDIASRAGILVLPGWECCTKWESHAGTGGSPWTERDYRTARRSMAAQSRALRNHACVLSFAIGSDFAPPAELAEIYLSELSKAEWSLPIVSSGATKWNNDPCGDPAAPDTTATSGAGPSGMKMWPYDWVPPPYWYSDKFGGAVGFDSECSAGHTIPRLPSLQRMLTGAEIEQLWQQPRAHHYHSAPSAPFATLEIFHAALAGRYGEISSLADFLRKAQLANYEIARAQFEAYRSRFGADRPATGVIYWMLTGAWPSLNWQLFDYYLDPAGAYFGAKKANEPLHIQFAYDTADVVVVNGSPVPAGGLTATITVRSIGGTVVASRRAAVDRVDAMAAVTIGPAGIPEKVSSTHFLELELSGAGGERVSRNVYWLSTEPDELDWGATTFQYTPQSRYADLTGLQGMATATVEIACHCQAGTDGPVTTVTVRNDSAGPAVGIHASLISPTDGLPVAPVRWEDNDITLFGGQQATLTARCPDSTVTPDPLVRVEGFNLVPQTVIPSPSRPGPASMR